MATIRLVIEDRLLRAADRIAKKHQLNRSALFREALRAFLEKEPYRELAIREREAYEPNPDDPSEIALWEEVAAWPEDSREAKTASTASSPRPPATMTYGAAAPPRRRAGR